MIAVRPSHRVWCDGISIYRHVDIQVKTKIHTFFCISTQLEEPEQMECLTSIWIRRLPVFSKDKYSRASRPVNFNDGLLENQNPELE